ncbi:CoA transferase [Cytobacillus oceanisediminis]|uniref:CaiB/BaiF CoA transferase family protein n=1 Tax=Cytobacillus oceanisediminis TaxID=665099 RepID=UPI0011A590F2|nr:CaiB/BaiF CoA-transferase family protein [Cytobacillus oceanisediminis]MBZ9536108.1 CoA transferase [Cytobacillus oceanisediminis]
MLNNNDKPLSDLLVLDFSQFLSGPSAGLRLADLGARVIKIERPDGGDLCRSLYISNLELDGDSTLFHSINRNKESFSVNLKDKTDQKYIQKLISKADILIQNFRPGVIEKLGLDYHSVKKINPTIIYGSISGYGKQEGPWYKKPGQDLLVQSLSGITRLSDFDSPLPFGLAIADMMAGAHLVQGILACLVQRGIRGNGGLVEVSLLESIIDIQSSNITKYLTNNQKMRKRIVSSLSQKTMLNKIYVTADGYLAIAVNDISEVKDILNSNQLVEGLNNFCSINLDDFKGILQEALLKETNEYWLKLFKSTEIDCEEVLTWQQLLEKDGFEDLYMFQDVYRRNGAHLKTTRCPIKIDGKIFTSMKGAPTIGEDNEKILKEFFG